MSKHTFFLELVSHVVFISSDIWKLKDGNRFVVTPAPQGHNSKNYMYSKN